MSHEERIAIARLIGSAIEDAIPEVRTEGESIVGGGSIHFRMPDYLSPCNPSDPLEFRVVFGSADKCRAAAEALTTIDIDAAIIAPHDTVLVCDGEELPTTINHWALRWSLPIDWGRTRIKHKCS